MYLYESCTGSLYTSKEELDYDEVRCGTCGDNGSFIGEFNSKKELIGLLRNENYDIDSCKDLIDRIYK